MDHSSSKLRYISVVRDGELHRNKPIYPILQALVSAALFGAATPASKVLLTSMLPYQLAGLLYLGAAIGVLPILLRQGVPIVPRTLNRKNQLLLLGAILCGGILAPVLLLLGLSFASAASVSMWLPLELVATALLGRWLFKEHLGSKAIAGLAGVVTAGVLLGIGEGTAGVAAGALVALACLCWGLDNNCTALIDGITPAGITFWKGLVAGGVNSLIGLAAGGFQGTTGPVAGALVVGALCYGASIALYISAAQSLGATRGQMFFASAPFFGLGLSAGLLGESISLVHLVAGSLLVGALILLFKDEHTHGHVHAAVGHRHTHSHDDGHHTHTHPGQPGGRHSHAHEHIGIVHTHRHLPDLHHRHDHGAKHSSEASDGPA